MDKNKRYKIGLIIPTYNDLEELKKFIFKINKNFKVLVVNDCSTDTTSTFLKKNNITYLENNKNLGYEKSILKGLVYLKKKKFNFAITFDADGEHKVSDLNKIYNRKIFLKNDIIICNRDKKNRFMEKIISFFFKVKYQLYDPLSGFKIYNLSKIKKREFYAKSFYMVDFLLNIKTFSNISNFAITTKKRVGKPRVGNLITVNFKLLRILFYILFK